MQENNEKTNRNINIGKMQENNETTTKNIDKMQENNEITNKHIGKMQENNETTHEKIWRREPLDSLAPAMNSFRKWYPWCDFSVVMWLEIFVVPATRDVTAAPWCELSRELVEFYRSTWKICIFLGLH